MGEATWTAIYIVVIGMGAAAALIQLAGFFLTAEERAAVRGYLNIRLQKRERSAEPPTTVYDSASQIFDTLFGRRIFSLKCFLMSALSSVVLLVICACALALIWNQTVASVASKLFEDDGWKWVALNIVVIDFISLMQTRVIYRLAEGRSSLLLVVAAALDLVVSAMLYAMISMLASPLLFPEDNATFEMDASGWIESTFQELTQRGENGAELNVFGVLAWSTLAATLLLHSLALYVYASGGDASRFGRLGVLWRNIRRSNMPLLDVALFFAAVSGLVLSALDIASL